MSPLLVGVFSTVLGGLLLVALNRLHGWLHTPRTLSRLEDYRADRPTESLTPTRWQTFSGAFLARVRWGRRRRRP